MISTEKYKMNQLKEKHKRLQKTLDKLTDR